MKQFQSKVEEAKFNETENIKELIEIFKRRLERKIDINLPKYTLLSASFNAYQTAANESFTHYMDSSNKFFENNRNSTPDVFEPMHEHFKANAIKQV